MNRSRFTQFDEPRQPPKMVMLDSAPLGNPPRLNTVCQVCTPDLGVPPKLRPPSVNQQNSPRIYTVSLQRQDYVGRKVHRRADGSDVEIAVDGMAWIGECPHCGTIYIARPL